MLSEHEKRELIALGETLGCEAAFWRPSLIDPEVPLNEVSERSMELCEKFRLMAMLVLLTKGNTDAFYHHLMRSGLVREAFLDRCRREGGEQDHHFASSRYQPLLDAAAAADWRLAERLVSLSPSEFRNGHEYKDDYCFAQIVHQLVVRPQSWGRIHQLLTEYQTHLGDETDTRLGVCQALADRDGAAFDESFEAYLADYQRSVRERVGRGSERYGVLKLNVCVDGLGLARLAESLGVATKPEYACCPSMARASMKKDLPGE